MLAREQDDPHTPPRSAGRTLKVGIVGVGTMGHMALKSVPHLPQIELVAVADIDSGVRERVGSGFSVRAYDRVDDLCRDAEVEVIWVATPKHFHCAHSVLAAEHGKHVVADKPMALSLPEAEQMVAAAEKNGVKILCAHNQGYHSTIPVMRRLIRSGQVGRLCAVNVWAYTDWMLRPRTPEELNVSHGGGIVYRAGPHQVDTVRFLAGGKVRSVKGTVGQWMAERPVPGYYSAYLEFEDGTAATIVHDAYGYFQAHELAAWESGRQRGTPEDSARARALLRAGRLDHDDAKNAQRDDRWSGDMARRAAAEEGKKTAWLPSDMGVLVASCERGSLRESPYGVYVYDDEGRHEIEVEELLPARRAEFEELYDGVVLGKPMLHDGRWGMATLEVCLAIMESSRERREVLLSHQVAVPEGL
jgi:phthalate 4,5-cis-dihydrodiol dehydrogenase